MFFVGIPWARFQTSYPATSRCHNCQKVSKTLDPSCSIESSWIFISTFRKAKLCWISILPNCQPFMTLDWISSWICLRFSQMVMNPMVESVKNYLKKTNPSNSSPWKSLPKRTFHDVCSLLTQQNVKTSFHSLHIKRRENDENFTSSKQRFPIRLTAEGSHVRNARQELLDQHILVDVTTVGIRWNHVGLDVKPLQKEQLKKT